MEECEDYGEVLDRELTTRLKELVDPICGAIVSGEMSRDEAVQAIERARLEAAIMIPDQLERYDLIYGSRFERLLEQFLAEG